MMNADSPPNLHAMLTPAQMQRILRRARLRADRCKGQMSVAVFELADASRATRRQLRRLARIVLRRSRMTDDIGWINEQQVCAVLPDTGPFGAHQFGGSVRTLAAKRGLEISYTIYSYPEHDEFDESDNVGKRCAPSRALGVQSTFSAGAPERTSAIPMSLDRRPLVAVVDRAMRCDEHRSVGTLSQLLTRDMPAWKRAMDIIGASIGLTIALPIMAIAALLIRVSSAGPVMFQQRRAGFSGARFTIFKFRTMVPNAEHLKAALRPHSEQDGPAFKMSGDPRITSIGRFLRATSLDELPQFWNVLVGNMSLVGPRPPLSYEFRAYDLWHRRRVLEIKPGITGFWQVEGRSRIRFDDMVRLDLTYARAWAISRD